jgi:hypothetical protein
LINWVNTSDKEKSQIAESGKLSRGMGTVSKEFCYKKNNQ